jgi:predicted DCC family thiol-disulfide oxidoreductase YuxK
MTRRAVILFDGHCGFCSRWVRRIHRLDPAGSFGFAAQQSQRGQTLLREAGLPAEPDSVVVLPVTGDGGGGLLRSDAAIYVAERLGFP